MFKGKYVLVTGGTGMIGRKLVELLVEDNAHVVSVSMDDLVLNDSITNVKADLSDFKFCKELVRGMDCVIHCAGVKGNNTVTAEKPASFFVPILQMNTNVLEACRLDGVDKVIYVSSKGVYKYESSLPGWAKKTGEKQIESYQKQYGVKNWFIVRPYNVFGEGDNFDPDSAMVVPSLMAKMARGDNPVQVLGDGSEIVDFAYSGDVAREILETKDSPNDIRGLEITIPDLLGMLHDFSGKSFVFTKMTQLTHSSFLTEEKREHMGNLLKKTYDWFLNHRTEHLRKVNYFA